MHLAREVRTGAVHSQHPSGGLGTVSPPHGPSSHHVQSHCECLRSVLLAPFTDKQTKSRRGPGLAQDHKLAGGTSHVGGAPFPPVWFSKVAKEILRAGGSPVGEGWETFPLGARGGVSRKGDSTLRPSGKLLRQLRDPKLKQVVSTRLEGVRP